ncbi:DUF4062 domain-containing protein [Vreelandella boliviensis]|uniref:DUF4062 domain-containing protein n=1 Tax=Vreelandella boliviensis LC1 TaxID=1072583 RepID=A0A265E0Q9_9GAMM|nr:DUF4062 domain-containing protein [Halomonas boliviensis]EHJ92870.1 hypothetical protein KUC_2828 [Halomonas boliviensis LC1]OZT75162.1 DUF4062 domain-containing protein [Halomonas boliviensis LC1]
MKKRLQVFISSTYIDLIEERQAAVGAVLKSGHIPAGMELFTAGDKSQLEIIKRWIDESDVYMLILGGRYGSVEPESGVSYTELEYNYALENDKPLFSVVIKEDALEEKVKVVGTSILEKERPAELKIFREKVLSNMSSFFEDEKDIRLCVMESLPDIASTRELSGWVSGSEVPNSKTLIDEITQLSKQVAELSKENAVLKEKALIGKKDNTETEFNDLKTVLKSIEIKIPPSSTGEDKELELDLFSLLIQLKDTIVTGVTNQPGQHDSYSFIYHNVCPKLQIHGIVNNEKVAGVRWRRFSITKLGQEFLAYIERNKFLVNT